MKNIIEMKSSNNKFSAQIFKISIIFLILSIIPACHKEEDLVLATFPTTPEVFIDGFSAGLDYFPFADSRQDAFSVDTKNVYEGSASMRFDVPNQGDPKGSYAGAIFPVPGGRDLSGYDALTFWAQASQAGTINEIGFGNDFGENNYLVTLKNLQLTNNWRKYTIPLPDPSKLIQERGLFWYAEGPENDKGYSFWIDELKYEKLGTVEQARPSILNGEDKILQTFIGVSTQIDGLTHTFNLESGEDVTVNPAPGYFKFSSSNPEIAAVDPLGKVSIIGTGSTIITATLKGKSAAGSLKIESLGAFSQAPIPTRDPNSVISIFSDAYTNVPVEYYNGYYAPFQTTQGQADIDINGDKIIKYSQLNFVASQFSKPTVNASGMTHFHVDIQIQDIEILSEDFIKIQLGDFGPDGVFDGGDDSNGSITLTSQNLERGKWLSLDIPLSDFTGLTNTSNLAQIFFITDGTAEDQPGTITDILVDNMYFYSGEVTPSSVLPIDFEDGGSLTGAFDGGANGLNADNPYQSGINTSSKVYQFNKVAGAAWYSGFFNIFNEDLDLSQGTNFKFKIWSPKANINVRFQLEKEGGEGTPPTYQIDQNLGEANTWVELSFDFSSTALNPADGYDKIVIFPDFDEGNQVPIESEIIYFVDDITQSTGGGTSSGPSTPAADPTQEASKVISVYSDVYTNISDTDFNPDWGQATVVTEESISGNNSLLYKGLNYQGIMLGSAQDVSAMDFLHIDYWTANSTALNTFLISRGPIETGIALSVPTNGEWTSIDIPLGEFTPVDLMDVFQMKFDGDGDIYLDNIYFYSNSGGNETNHSTAAPEPTQEESNVVSVFSDSYTNIIGTDLNPDWGQATLVTEEQIEGNNTLVFIGLNYQGIMLGSAQDVSAMEFLHIDYWTANSDALNTFLISDGPIESAFALAVPTGGGWSSVDVPLEDFNPVDLMDVIQIKFDGNGDVYLDNIYFYSNGGGNETTPSTAAPEPTQEESNVVSVFSDSYTNVAGTDLNPDWGQATLVTEEQIEDNNTLVYTGLNYQGIMLGSAQDVSAMEFLHIDYWTANSDALNTFLISDGPIEAAFALSVPTGGGWSSVNIPLGDFPSVDLMDVIQMKFDGNGDIYLDNIYFYAVEGESSVASLPIDFEDGSTLTGEFDGGANGLNANNPDQSGINTSSKVYQFNKVAGSAWYSGTFNILSADIDPSKGNTFKFKIWSPNAGINIRFQLEKEGNQGPIVTYSMDQTVSEANQWVEVTFDFSSTAINLADGYDKIVIFPDFNDTNQVPVAEEAIYFIDDITQE